MAKHVIKETLMVNEKTLPTNASLSYGKIESLFYHTGRSGKVQQQACTDDNELFSIHLPTIQDIHTEKQRELRLIINANMCRICRNYGFLMHQQSRPKHNLENYMPKLNLLISNHDVLKVRSNQIYRSNTAPLSRPQTMQHGN